MPCKHEGGSDPCVRSLKWRYCFVGIKQYRIKNAERLRKQVKLWRQKNAEHLKQQTKDWHTQNKARSLEARRTYRQTNINGSSTPATPSDAGEAGELLVACDLLTRGLQVTKPLNRNGADDLHVKLKRGWVTIQVKVRRVNKKTGGILKPTSHITSEVIAGVDLAGKRIRYISNTDEPIPPELQ